MVLPTTVLNDWRKGFPCLRKFRSRFLLRRVDECFIGLLFEYQDQSYKPQFIFYLPYMEETTIYIAGSADLPSVGYRHGSKLAMSGIYAHAEYHERAIEAFRLHSPLPICGEIRSNTVLQFLEREIDIRNRAVYTIRNTLYFEILHNNGAVALERLDYFLRAMPCEKDWAHAGGRDAFTKEIRDLVESPKMLQDRVSR
ncbi:MAG: hypothetical protein AAFR53_13350, partial [Pseudomonadota bacterium]